MANNVKISFCANIQNLGAIFVANFWK